MSCLPVRVAFIGTGGVSGGHIKRINDNPAAQIVALCDTNRETVRERAKLVGRRLPLYADYQAMLAKEEIDAAVICTPHTLHFQQAMDCLDRGIHVLVEKPLVCTVEDGRKLIAKSEKAGKTLMVSYQRHYHPEFMWTRDAIAKGDLGKVFYISAYLSQSWASITSSWRGRMALSGGGELMDSGSHIVDIICWLSQLDPVEVTAFVSNEFALDEEVDILSSVCIRFSNRAIGSVCINGNAPWYERLIISGTQGTLSFGEGTRLRLPNGEYKDLPAMPAARNPDDNFIAVVQGNEESMSPGKHALKVVQITQAAYLSEKEKRAVRIDEL